MSSDQVQKGYSYERDDRDLPRRRFSSRELQSDKNHLFILSVFYYVASGILALIGCIPMIHVTIGIAMVSGSMGPPPQGPPPELGFMFIAIGSTVIVLMWTMAACVLFAGRSLATYRHSTFIIIVAALLCTNAPLGTLLGVFTIITLMRESVKELFAHGEYAFGPDEGND